MLFDTTDSQRRKSSMVSDEKVKLAKQVAAGGKTTGPDSACFVHQLLEKQKKSKSGLKPMNVLGEDEDRAADKGAQGHDGEKRVHSRLLTKKELSDMARGVRELSKKLGSIRLRLHVKSVFLLIKAHDPSLIEKAKDMVDWLLSKERDTPYIV